MSKPLRSAMVRVVTLAVLASSVGLGCDARLHRIGEGLPVPPSGGEGGSGMAGATGGSSGSGGAPGTGGAPEAPAPARPLPVAANQAVTRMARLLWESAPDATLLNIADSGALATSEDVRQLALRMLLDPRAKDGLGGFYRWWLDLDRLPSVEKDLQLFPLYNAELARDMALETETFAVSVTLGNPGTFAMLLAAPHSYLNERLAAVYGLSDVSGPDLRLTLLDPLKRAGLLTQPSFLAKNAHPTITSPTLRGEFIAAKVRCSPVGVPVGTVDTSLDPAQPGQTTRQRVEAKISSAPCAGVCHVHLEGVGFAYEHYDAIGQYRTVDNGSPINSSAQLSSVTVADAIGMAHALAEDRMAQECMPRQWLRYGLGREVGSKSDEAAVTDAYRWFARSGFVLRELIAGVIQTDAFLTEPPVCTPGVDQTCK